MENTRAATHHKPSLLAVLNTLEPLDETLPEIIDEEPEPFDL
jgi:hypothetical protein